MYCSKCGHAFTERSRYCPGCGQAREKKPVKLVILLAFSIMICAGVFTALYFQITKSPSTEQAVKKKEKPKVQVSSNQTAAAPAVKEPAKKAVPSAAAPKEVSEVIEKAQPKVFTIFSDTGQGSGFLINDNGDVLTNAHVVEGSLNVTIHDSEGTEHSGTVIGYSNTVDIAVVRVPDFTGRTPLSLETINPAKLGDEVIALGSPEGYENTATLGNISGVNRSFVIPPHSYDGIYQISAPIAPGSSGGPLLDKKTEKVLAINSARSSTEATIGFSIPIYQVADTINGWVQSPMSAEEINALFYNDQGESYYGDFYDNGYYFDGGDTSDDYTDPSSSDPAYGEPPSAASPDSSQSSESDEPAYSEPADGSSQDETDTAGEEPSDNGDYSYDDTGSAEDSTPADEPDENTYEENTEDSSSYDYSGTDDGAVVPEGDAAVTEEDLN